MKKLKVGVLFAVVALLAISCSHLFEDDEPQNLPPPPPSPSRSLSGQRTLTFYVNDGNGEAKPVKVNVDGKTATLAQIQSAYATQYPNAPVPAGWQKDGKWYKGGTTTDINDVYPNGNSIPEGTMLDIGLTPTGVGYKASIITFSNDGKVKNGEVKYIATETEQPLSAILDKAGIEAGSGNYEPSHPAGWDFVGWAKADATETTLTPTDLTQYDSGTSFVAVYKAPYELNTGAASPNPKVQIIAPNTGVALKDIFKAAGVNDVKDATAGKPADKDLAMGWKVTLPDGTEYVVSSKQINNGTGKAAETFPPGTKIEPNWVTNAEAATGGSDRTLTNLNTGSPNIGDGVTSDGKIIPKDLVGQEIAKGKNVLGYIYHVDTSKKQVKVVAKEVQPVRHWSRYASKMAYTNNFDGVVSNIESGFDAWIRIVNKNPSAVYENYEAILYAVCYPKIPKKETDSDFKPEIHLNYPLGDDNQRANSNIDNVVNGDGYDNRWYLPAVKELEMIYAAGDKLLNWTETSHQGVGTTWLFDKIFWSVNISLTTATNAKRVDFTQTSGGKPIMTEVNKFKDTTTQVESLYNILPVAEFKYEDYQVNR